MDDAGELPSPAAAGGGEGIVPAADPSAVESPRAAAAQAQASPGPTPLHGAAFLIVGLGLALANFMAVLDTSIANVSVPNIAGGLAVSPDEGTWVITSYGVAEAITVPLTGWLAARFGTVRVFITAICLFAVFSALCGLAPSLGALILFRVCQGLCGGPMIPLSQTLLLRVFPKEQAGQAIGLWSMTTVVAPIAGPLLGGFLSDNYGWQWVFYVNIPIAALAGFLAFRNLKPYETKTRDAPIDTVGLGLLVVWVSALQIALDKGKELDWFASSFICTLVATAVVGFAAFLIWELTSDHPIVNLKVFRHRAFSTAVGIMCFSYAAFFASGVLVPLWLQTDLGYTATEAGRVTAFNGVLAIVFSPIVGKFVGKVDPRILIFGGLVWLAAVFWSRTWINTDVTYWQLVLPQVLVGAGIPFFFIPLMSLGTGSLPPDEVASGASLISFTRTTAGAFAVSLVTTSWADRGSADRVAILGQAGDQAGTIAKMQQPGMDPGVALQQFEGLVQTQSVMLATNEMFQVIACLFLISALIVWIAPKPRRGAKAPVGAH